jgi:ankyrin repeat protein
MSHDQLLHRHSDLPASTRVPSLRLCLPVAGKLALLISVILAVALRGDPAADSLFEAVSKDDLQAVQALLDQKADIDARNQKGRTPLMMAVISGRADMVKLLLDSGADVSARDGNGATASTAKMLAQKLGADDLIRLMNESAMAGDPQRAFLAALKRGDIEGMRCALDRGADVNRPIFRGETPLMKAASMGWSDQSVLKFLLDKGATVNASDDSGKTAYDYADLPGKPTNGGAQSLLLERGIITKPLGAKQLNESLRRAVEDGDADMVKALLNRKADPNFIGQYGHHPPVMEAASARRVDIVKLLLGHGADPDQVEVGIPQRTALVVAAELGDIETVTALIAKGANVNARAVERRTPLMFAAGAGQLEVVKLFLEKGADPNAKTEDGRTALSFADGTKRTEVERFLRDPASNGQLSSDEAALLRDGSSLPKGQTR